MKQLPQILTKNIFTYTQIRRNEKVAIYEQRISENQRLVGHEVFVIPKYEDREIAGVFIPAHEGYPGDNAFGVYAFSTGMDMERAFAKFDLLTEEVNRPKKVVA
jgi:hypothetical protein